jgi:hypothetical protein
MVVYLVGGAIADLSRHLAVPFSTSLLWSGYFLMVMPWTNYIPIAPILGLAASMRSVNRERQIGDLVALPYTVGWWLLTFWFGLSLLAMTSD